MANETSSPPGPPQLADENVSEFGYKQEMKRELGWFTSFSVAFGFVSIATGIFTTYAAVIQTSGPRGIWTWAVAALGQLAVAFVFGALAARIPVSGYSYQWVSRLANPILGWIMGWVSFTFLGVVVVAVDYTIASAITPVLFNYEGNNWNAWLITAVVILVQAVLVAWSTRATQRVNNVAVTIQIIAMITLTVLLLGVGLATRNFDVDLLFTTGHVPEEGYFSVGSLTSAGPWALGFLLGAFTIVGFESAANLAEETRDPARVVPKAMWQAVLSLGVLGMLFLIAVTGNGVSAEALAGSGQPVAEVITNVLGPVVGKALLVMVVISIFSCGLVISMSGARLVWAMSRDQRFPGWQLMNSINHSSGTPLNAMLFMMVIAQAILAIFSFTSTDAMFALFSAGTLLPALIYAGTVLLYIIKRKTLPPSMGFTLGKWEIPVLLAASAWLIYELLIFRDEAFRESWSYLLIMFAVGAVYLAYLLLRHGRHALKMPDMHDIDKELDT
ncbi:APC family permease [Tessaracoccus sp. G1721]